MLLPGNSCGRRSLVGCSPWGCWESDTTERLHFHFSLSCTGEGNGNPLQYPCLENPRDGGAWWADVCGVTQSWRQLKWLSSRSIQSSANGIISFSFYGWLIFHCKYNTTSSLSIPFFFFFGGHLGCFCVLAILNSAAMNIRVHVSLELWFSWEGNSKKERIYVYI